LRNSKQEGDFMFRKAIGLGLLLIIAFSFGACEGGLLQYKNSAKAELDSYAVEKGEDNYTKENWWFITDFVREGKMSIEDAKDKAEVDSALVTAKDRIAGVEKIDFLQIYKDLAKGKLENYVVAKGEKNYLVKDWIVIMGFVGKKKAEIDAAKDETSADSVLTTAKEKIDNLEMLELSIEDKIRYDYYERMLQIVPALAAASEYTIEKNVFIIENYGIYNDSVAVLIEAGFIELWRPNFVFIIDEVEFNTNCRILVWNEGDFYSLATAYVQDLLTKSDIEKIYELRDK